MSRRLVFVLGSAAACLVAATCTDLPSGPDTPFALELARPASPSVVRGDTLRDSLGRVAPLRAVAYNVNGDTITGAEITFQIINAPNDTTTAHDSTPATIDASGRYVVAKGRRIYPGRTFRVVAGIASIETVPVQLTVTRRPDTLLFAGNADSVATMTLSFRDTLPLSPALSVRLRHRPDADETPGDTTVPAYLVNFRIVRPAAADTDTAYVMLTNGDRKRSQLDTADASGVASRQVRVRFNLFPFTRNVPGDTVFDTVRVEARAYRPGGAPVPGSGRQLLLIIKGLKITTPAS